ncbi:MAG: hypothetical protein CVV02_07935 [Firmicutes bacterium HGW-Firmicutes-7]|nr:MAG: hypothetical protein CVV02_07935 [Firmicutes bacterium HGW-Firmicutes-7]
MIYFLNMAVLSFFMFGLFVITYYYLVKKIKIQILWGLIALSVMMCVIIVSMIVFCSKYGLNSLSIGYVFLIYILFIVMIHDLIDQSIPLKWLAFGGVMGSYMLIYNPNISLLEGVVGSIITGILLLLLSKITRGGIGIGDVFVFVLISLIAGWKMSMTVLIFALVLCGCIGIVLFAFKKAKRKTTIPFMPFIFAMTIFVLWL